MPKTLPSFFGLFGQSPATEKRLPARRRKRLLALEVLEGRRLLVGGTFHVLIPNDAPDTDHVGLYGSLRWAVDQAYGDPGANVQVDAGVNPVVQYGPITLPYLGLVINAQGATITSKTGDTVFVVRSGTAATITDATFINASAGSTSPLVVSDGSLDLENCVFIGGGLASQTTGPTQLTVNNTVFKNIAGVATNISAATGGGQANFNHVTWTGNTGQVISYLGDPTAFLTVANSQITGNNNGTPFPTLNLGGPYLFTNTTFDANISTGAMMTIEEGGGETGTFSHSSITNGTAGTTTNPVAGHIIITLSNEGTVVFDTINASSNTTHTGPLFYITGTGTAKFLSSTISHNNDGAFHNSAGVTLNVDSSTTVSDNGDGSGGSGGTGGSGGSGGSGSGSGGTGGSGGSGGSGSGSGGTGGSGGSGGSGSGSTTPPPVVDGFNGVAGQVTTASGQVVSVNGRGVFVGLGAGRPGFGKLVLRARQGRRVIKIAFPKLVIGAGRPTGVAAQVGRFIATREIYVGTPRGLQDVKAGTTIVFNATPSVVTRDLYFLLNIGPGLGLLAW